jgi:hypothetical protein
MTANGENSVAIDSYQRRHSQTPRSGRVIKSTETVPLHISPALLKASAGTSAGHEHTQPPRVGPSEPDRLHRCRHRPPRAPRTRRQSRGSCASLSHSKWYRLASAPGHGPGGTVPGEKRAPHRSRLTSRSSSKVACLRQLRRRLTTFSLCDEHTATERDHAREVHQLEPSG